MATIQIYHLQNDTTYNVNIGLFSSQVKPQVGDFLGQDQYYLKITTNLRKLDGTSYPDFVIFSLSDTPPGYSGAPITTFSGLLSSYIDYYMEDNIINSSSSSSSSSGSSSSSSLQYSSSSSSSSSLQESSSSS